MRYVLLNGLVLMVVIAYAYAAGRAVLDKPLLVTGIVLLGLTAVFDNLIILSSIVGYDQTAISGLLLYHAPIEDFAYTLAAVLLVPVIWQRGGKVW